jgi:hypothetical protein
VLHAGYAYTVSLVSTKARCEVVCAPGKCAADSMEAMPERRTGGRSWPVGRGLGAASTLHASVPVFARRDTYDSFEGFAEGRVGSFGCGAAG